MIAGARAIAAVSVLGLAGIGVQTLRLSMTERDMAEVRAEWGADRAQAAEASRQAEAEARAKEQMWIKRQKEADDANELRLQGLRADAAIASAAAGRLRDRVATLIAQARATATGAPAVEGGPPAADPAGVLADVFGRLDKRAGELARIADERGAAGALCEREYDTLTDERPAP